MSRKKENILKDLAFIYMYYTFCNGEYFTGHMIEHNYNNFMKSIYNQSRMYKEIWELKPSLKFKHLRNLFKKIKSQGNFITKEFLKKEIGKAVVILPNNPR